MYNHIRPNIDKYIKLFYQLQNKNLKSKYSETGKYPYVTVFRIYTSTRHDTDTVMNKKKNHNIRN